MRPPDQSVQPALWPDLRQREVLLAVGGGIAAYKVAELCRMLRRCGAQVQVMMSDAAQRFVGVATFAALSQRAVATNLFDPQQEADIGHIAMADRADLLLVAPATADLLAKFSTGIADTLVSTVYLAYRGPVLLAPAMNVNMWQHPATVNNVAILRQRGHLFVGPEVGQMACQHVGAGRLADPEQILQAVGSALSPKTLEGKKVVVTAGPTHEPIDAVRFIGNRSSGKMGLAMALEALARGADVTVVHGPGPIFQNAYGVTGLQLLPVQTAAQMYEQTMTLATGADVVVLSAAVADFRPIEYVAEKIKKESRGESFALSLEHTCDILRAVVSARGANRTPTVIGFAAETGNNWATLAAEKYRSKGCDVLIANDVGQPSIGFDADENAVTVFGLADQPIQIGRAPKRQVAAHVWDAIAQWRR